ncbi:pteridine reductase [Legionella maioricensis]|uniref:Pteridine reductase n=1 Tax=Legionella maioricensis TaxID=2896528 RepID=A0A9X2CY64_9GAMM|nr:pteridine reductase [Legionella maioricensis]MCL9682963.1 pteridine reductase [Legionella maioricensis]MCL9686311.1 pteridine reductase [Legionella maioricensis]
MNQANKQEAKVALVTGGARRIGAAIVKTVHEAGYKVVIHCRGSLDEAHALAVHLNQLRIDSAFVLSRELTETDAPQEMMTTIIDWAGRLDLLVNNASTFIRTEYPLFNPEDWQALFDTNVKAPLLLSLAAYPFLKTQQGVIINITDIHAEKPLKGYSVYCQSKAALKMQTESLAREFAPEVRVNAVAPGATIWPEDANVLKEVEKEKIIANTPLKAHGKPEYIAQAVLALAQNPFITGQTLKVDGGRSLMG